MRIPCPCCGERCLEEFSYHGDAAPRRPAADAGAAEWHDYVYLRDNPDGAHSELWYHSGGCRQWLVVTRDMRSHAISQVIPARERVP